MSAICFPSVEKILKMEQAEPTDSCEAILAPLRYARGRGAAVLLKSDPLPDILQYCSEHRVHFRDAVFSSKMRDVATTCGPKYVLGCADDIFECVASYRRGSDLYPSAELFDDDIDADDVSQGALGDCWLVAFIAALAGKHPELVRSCFGDESDDNTVANEVGVYTVRFWDKNEKDWCWVVVDDLIPLKPDGTPKFAETRSETEIWPMILEKAMAKLAGAYEGLIGSAQRATFLPGYFDLSVGVGSVMRMMTGSQLVKCHRLNTGSVPPAAQDALFAEVREALQMGAIVTAGTNGAFCSLKDDLGQGGKKTGLVGKHAYSILGAATVGGVDLFHCRNPWGGTEWGGAWRDDVRVRV
jgi:hypothetical protein